MKPHPKEGKLWGEDGVGTRTESVYVFLLVRVQCAPAFPFYNGAELTILVYMSLNICGIIIPLWSLEQGCLVKEDLLGRENCLPCV